MDPPPDLDFDGEATVKFVGGLRVAVLPALLRVMFWVSPTSIFSVLRLTGARRVVAASCVTLRVPTRCRDKFDTFAWDPAPDAAAGLAATADALAATNSIDIDISETAPTMTPTRLEKGFLIRSPPNQGGTDGADFSPSTAKLHLVLCSRAQKANLPLAIVS